MLWTLTELYNEHILNDIKNEMPGLQIISYRKFSLPVQKYEVIYKVSGSAAANMTEEFVLDALTAGFTFPVNKEFIASALGLDVIFIESCIEKLARLKIIDVSASGDITLRARGKAYAENHLLPDKDAQRSIMFYYDKKFGGIYTEANGTAPTYDKFEQVDEYITDKTKFISPQLICTAGALRGEQIENPEKGELISGFSSAEVIGGGEVDFIEVWVYDFVNAKVFCRVFDCERFAPAEDLTKFVSTYTYLNEITNPEKYIQLKSSNYDRETEYTEIARNAYSAARFEGKNIDSAAPVRVAQTDEKIEIPDCKRLIVMSPWLYSEVTDTEFTEAMQRAEYTLFGYGDGITPDASAAASLLKITDKQGIPKVLPCFIPGIKEKELLAENIMHCVGSIDYSVGEDDYYKPGESVYIVRDKELVAAADKRLCGIFLDHIGGQPAKSDRYVIAVLNVCSMLLGKDEFKEYLNTVINISKEEALHNIYVFMLKKGMISAEEFAQKTNGGDKNFTENF